ncbi:hypothetical protein [Methyloterricola oryzae]|uniref:hypothetical protein n=1 Tax=Methyloterricola oryzae TaxID=1495050 RepID=UPI0005EB7AAF|nr:hypothetical protein [Methyloterricola oryzae]
MTDENKELGVAITLLERLASETVPKALEIKERVDRGEKLDHWDIEFLEKLFKRAEEVRPMVDRHPEYQDIFAKAVHLYKEISDQALKNEQASGGC